jgi:hypothetical protein
MINYMLKLGNAGMGFRSGNRGKGKIFMRDRGGKVWVMSNVFGGINECGN